MQETTNLKLKKPEYNEYADIQDINDNMDILDSKINEKLDSTMADNMYSKLNHKHEYSDINNLVPLIQNTKVNASAQCDNANMLDNIDSTGFMRSYMGDGNLSNDLGVALYLRWSAYGQHHIIFDASKGIRPDGQACSNHNANVGWTYGHPNLMAFNGTDVYGVRVDSARWADSASGVQGFQFRNNNGILEVLVNGEWLSVGARQFLTLNRANATLRNQRGWSWMNHKYDIYSFSGKSGFLRSCFFNLDYTYGQSIMPVAVYVVIDGNEMLVHSWKNSNTAIDLNYYEKERQYGGIPITNVTILDNRSPIFRFLADINLYFKNSFAIRIHFIDSNGTNDTVLCADCPEIIFYT